MLIRNRRLPVFGLIVLLLLAGSLRLMQVAADDAPAPAELSFGPRLYLIVTATDETPSALPPTVVLHARLNVDMGGFSVTHYVASGSAEDQAAMEAAGLAVRVLDEDTATKVYYFADATADGAADLATPFGPVIYTDANVLLIAAPQTTEQAMLETLLAQGISLAALTPDPLNLQRADELIVDPAASGESAAPDPVIAGLLNLITEGELTTLIRELSGEVAVTIGQDTITLNTRYTLSTRVLDAARYLHQYYTNLGLQPSYFDWTYGNYSGRNVIAELRGIEHPERIWIVGGHYDSISNAPTSSAPGADDNGTGTAAVMLIAKILRNYQFADTIRFVHFSGEEQGQWGSKRYASKLNQDDAQIVGVINLDMIGWDGNSDRVVELHTGMGTGSNALGTAFIQNNDEYGQGLVIERKTTSASRFSDHSPFWDNGYPAFLAIENFFDDAIARDRNPQYHKTGDKLNLVNVNYVARSARVALATMAELSGLRPGNPGTPTPTPTATLTPTPTASPTAAPEGCANLLANGGFEASGGWQFGSTPYAAGIVNTVRYAGQRSLRLGLPATVSNRRAHSSAFQKVTLPADAEQIVLRFWQRPGGSGDGVDYHEALLLNSQYGFLATLERATAIDGADQWSERSFDLTTQRGKTVVVYFNVYNNGSGSQQWNYVDSVELLVCRDARSLPLETATPTPTISTTAEASETPGETPTPTPTATTTPTLVATAPPSTNGESQIYLPLIQSSAAVP